MKYKGIELKDNTEAELLIAIQLPNFKKGEAEKSAQELDKLRNILNGLSYSWNFEFLDFTLWNIRSKDFTLDKTGVHNLVSVYKSLDGANFSYAKIFISVHVDVEEWFTREDGSEYNEDMVGLEEFLENIKY